MKNQSPLVKAFQVKVTHKKQYFMQRAKVWKEARKVMSYELAESVVRTWERQKIWK
tara:strand:- start:677 stop:844 length:168 start_codon:yes stop_codon:yes gene_type:complete